MSLTRQNTAEINQDFDNLFNELYPVKTENSFDSGNCTSAPTSPDNSDKDKNNNNNNNKSITNLLKMTSINKSNVSVLEVAQQVSAKLEEHKEVQKIADELKRDFDELNVKKEFDILSNSTGSQREISLPVPNVPLMPKVTVQQQQQPPSYNQSFNQPPSINMPNGQYICEKTTTYKILPGPSGSGIMNNIPPVHPSYEYKQVQQQPIMINNFHRRANSGEHLLDISNNIRVGGGAMRSTNSCKTSPISTPYTRTPGTSNRPSRRQSPIPTHSPNNWGSSDNLANLNVMPIMFGSAGNTNTMKNKINIKKEAGNIKKEYKDRPFRCTEKSKKDPTKQCESAFARMDELKRHLKIHDPNKPYKCQFCEMKFSRTDHLTTHTRTHTKEKPYACQYQNCTKKFARSDERLRHHQVHENRIKKQNENKLKKEIGLNQSVHYNNGGQFLGGQMTNSQYFSPNQSMTSSMNSDILTSGHNRSSMSSSVNITYPPTPAIRTSNYNSPAGSGYVTPALPSSQINNQVNANMNDQPHINYGHFQ